MLPRLEPSVDKVVFGVLARQIVGNSGIKMKKISYNAGAEIARHSRPGDTFRLREVTK